MPFTGSIDPVVQLWWFDRIGIWQKVGISVFSFYFYLFSFWQFLIYYTQDFAWSFNIIASYLTMTSYTLYNSTAYTHMHHGQLDWLWASYIAVWCSKCQFFTETKCADCSIRVYWSFSIWVVTCNKHLKGYPALYHSILLHFILSIATVTTFKQILLKFAPIMPVFCFLLLPSCYSNNFTSKIDVSLAKGHLWKQTWPSSLTHQLSRCLLPRNVPPCSIRSSPRFLPETFLLVSSSTVPSR